MGTEPHSVDHSAGCAYVDGDFVPIGDAKISLLDAGLSRSDVTYDVVGVWNGAFFRLDDHLDRFERSCKELHLDPGVDRRQLTEILHECVRRSGLREAYVDMIASRGMPRGSRDPRTYDNRFYAYAIPYVWIVQPDDQITGSHLVVARNTIRIPEAAVDPTVKNFHWGDLVRGMFEAYDRGGTVVVLPDADGNVTEGPGFNVFALVDGVLVTPATGVLEGVTRRTVLDLADDLGITARLDVLPADDLRRADEVFMSSTAGGVMPVVTVDGNDIGDGRPGELTMRLRQAYWDAHDDPRWATPVAY
jgi:branched-chain amino acid aminotransferase